MNCGNSVVKNMIVLGFVVDVRNFCIQRLCSDVFEVVLFVFVVFDFVFWIIWMLSQIRQVMLSYLIMESVVFDVVISVVRLRLVVSICRKFVVRLFVVVVRLWLKLCVLLLDSISKWFGFGVFISVSMVVIYIVQVLNGIWFFCKLVIFVIDWCLFQKLSEFCVCF